MRFRLIFWLGLLLGVLASLYSLLALAMVGSLSEAPNLSAARASYNMQLWGICLLLSALTAATCGAVLIRKKKT